jgi:hypothetical protein
MGNKRRPSGASGVADFAVAPAFDERLFRPRTICTTSPDPLDEDVLANITSAALGYRRAMAARWSPVMICSGVYECLKRRVRMSPALAPFLRATNTVATTAANRVKFRN